MFREESLENQQPGQHSFQLMIKVMPHTELQHFLYILEQSVEL